jgi:hypothetical protein
VFAGVGVSGGTAEQDVAIVEAALIYRPLRRLALFAACHARFPGSQMRA